MALEEGLPLCNVGFPGHYGGSFAHIALTGPEHFHDFLGVDDLPQREGDGTQAVAHQQSKSTVPYRVWLAVVVAVEDNYSSYVYTA